jgi:alpha-1,2-mannosyltransferase
MPEPERRRSRNFGVAAIVVVVLAFGAITEMRSAFLTHRHTDAGIYFRAAWAVQAGESLYEITDDNGWHYHYAPLLAILMVPFADPPPGEARGLFVPYPIAVAFWYALGAGALVWGVHRMARAVEGSTAVPALRSAPFTRPWWMLRIVPCATCLAAIGETLGRGQPGTLVLLCVAGMIASLPRRRGGRAGLWLSAAICLKIFPVYLLLYPVVRRDWRCLAGCAVGLLIGLLVIPMATLGPARTTAAYEDFYRLVLRGAVTDAPDPSTVEEFYHERTGDVMSFRSVLFKTVHPDPDSRPPTLAAWYDWAQKLLGVAVTLLMAAALRRPAPRHGRAGDAGGPDSVPTTMLALGLMLVAVIPLVPVAQPHYYMLALVLVMGLMADEWERGGQPRLSRRLGAVLALYATANLLPYLPGLDTLMDHGLAMYAGLALWLVGLVALWRRRGAAAGGVPVGS